MSVSAVWFRNDLRVDDHPALTAAAKRNESRVVAVCIISKQQWRDHGVGNNAQALYLSALKHLAKDLAGLGIELSLLEVDWWRDIPEELERWVKQHQVEELHFNVELPLDERERDKCVYERLNDTIKIVRHQPDTLSEPWRIENQQGAPFKVFTPYSKRVRALIEHDSLQLCEQPKKQFNKVDIEKVLKSIDKVATDSTISIPDVSQDYLRKQIKQFFETNLNNYSKYRDFPALDATSSLSPALAVGAISVRRLFKEATEYSTEAFKWTTELIWRDFYRYIMWHFPNLSKGQSFRSDVEQHIQWNHDDKQFERWCAGETGVPIVDAAMRQLNNTGWMHNRLRMIVASFLTKNLWIDWRRGESYFAEKLFDYDFASNNGGWQWSASVGTDAAPYFRVFSPVSQAEKFDPEAKFIRNWVEELSDKSAKAIHSFEGTALSGYPSPMVDIKFTRKLAIENFKQAMKAVG